MVKALVMDVDGTLTDGGIYMGNSGECMKRFDVKDGYAIAKMLPQLSIVPIIITGRTSDILKNRCEELNVKYVIQGCENKKVALMNLLTKLNITLDETAYIGDDLNDFDCMQIVGIKGCPSDSDEEIKKICNYVCERKGGFGAVREFVTYIKKCNGFG